MNITRFIIGILQPILFLVYTSGSCVVPTIGGEYEHSEALLGIGLYYYMCLLFFNICYYKNTILIRIQISL
jgi:ABC-type multidrug transport system permease subunit